MGKNGVILVGMNPFGSRCVQHTPTADAERCLHSYDEVEVVRQGQHWSVGSLPERASLQLQSRSPPPTSDSDVVARLKQDSLDSALERRPDAWSVCPPGLREFAIWCATGEPAIWSATIAAALSGAKQP